MIIYPSISLYLPQSSSSFEWPARSIWILVDQTERRKWAAAERGTKPNKDTSRHRQIDHIFQPHNRASDLSIQENADEFAVRTVRGWS